MIFYSKKLSSFKTITHGFSGRQDEGKLPENIVTLKQIHTDEVVMVDRTHPLPVSLPPASCAKVALATAAEQGGGTKKKKEMTRSKNKVEIRCGFPDDF